MSWTKFSLNEYFPYVVSFGMSLLNGVLIPVIPLLAFSMGASQIELGIIGSAAPLINLPLSFVTGRMSDRFGRKPLMAASSLLYAMACIFFSASSSPLHLMGVKLLEGLSVALLWPPLEALLADSAIIKGHVLASNFGVSWSLGTTLGALAASLVISTGRYRDSFLPAATVSLVFSLATLAIVSEKRVIPKSSGHQIAERNSTAPLQIKSVWLAAFLYAFCQGIVFALYPPFAEYMGVPAFVIGLAITSLMMGRTLVFLFFRRLKAQFKVLAMTGSAVMGMAALPLSLTIEPWIILALSLTLGFGLGLVYSASIMMALSSDEVSSRGKYAGFFEGSIGAGYFFGPIFGGSMAQVALQGPYAICSAAALISLLSIFKSEIE